MDDRKNEIKSLFTINHLFFFFKRFFIQLSEEKKRLEKRSTPRPFAFISRVIYPLTVYQELKSNDGIAHHLRPLIPYH